MSVKVLKLIVVVDDETASQIEELAGLSVKERESRPEEFTYTGKYGVDVQMHFVTAEVV